MAEMELEVFCYWNGCIKYGRDGVYYEGSTPKVIKVKRKTELRRFLDELYLVIGLDTDKQRSKVKIFGRYPCVVGQSMVKYLLLPVVNDDGLEAMLEVPSNHPSIKNVELYLKVKSDAAAGSSKRQRIDAPVKLEMDNGNGWIEDEADAEGGGDMTEKDSEFEADEIERVVRLRPAQSFAELKKWWKAKFGYKLDASEVRAAKEEAIKRVFGDWDQSFEDLPKLMSALHSSNGLLMEWKYDIFPNPKFASFCGVFWAFSQSVEGFPHCRPLIIVDNKDLGGKDQLKLMIASGVDAANTYFPLAFAVTKQVSADSWRWFLSRIREKVTQRKGLCLISSPHKDIVSVVNEPESQWEEPWAYHRFCLKQFLCQFSRVFPDYDDLKSFVKLAGSTSGKKLFDCYMEEIKERNQEAWKWLDKFPPHKWALSHDSGMRYGIIEIDTKPLFACCRGFGLADHVLTGSVLLLFDELRYFFESASAYNGGDLYTKPVTDKLEEFRKASVADSVMPLENNTFPVFEPTGSADYCILHFVDLSDSTCSCGEFERFKFPCRHALAVCKKLKINPLQYVDDSYSVERYHKTYVAKFNPVPELSAWPEAPGVPRLFPPSTYQEEVLNNRFESKRTEPKQH